MTNNAVGGITICNTNKGIVGVDQQIINNEFWGGGGGVVLVDDQILNLQLLLF